MTDQPTEWLLVWPSDQQTDQPTEQLVDWMADQIHMHTYNRNESSLRAGSQELFPTSCHLVGSAWTAGVLYTAW
jgi:hypothetical protein